MTNHQIIKSTPIGIIGSGAMGSGIAQVAAAAGHPVILYDAQAAALEKAQLSLSKTIDNLVQKGKIASPEGNALLGRIRYAQHLKELSSCGLIIEAIVEHIDIKKQVFSEAEALVHENCILASNTSSLSITSIASACKKPERIVGIHFFNPAPLMPLVEIIPGIATDPQTLQTAKQYIDSWGKITVLAKDTPGFIVNRIARPYYGEAIRIYEEGIADPATIDWAMRSLGGFRMGPFELMDFIGNDVNYKVTETVWEQFFYEPRYKPSFTQKRLYEAGFFGRKSGRGYYNYAENAMQPEPDQDEALGHKILQRILSMLINEAAEALYLGIASREDIDMAMTKGVNYPKGLLKWADEISIETTLKTLAGLYEEYGEDRYRPSVLLKKMASERKTFY